MNDGKQKPADKSGAAAKLGATVSQKVTPQGSASGTSSRLNDAASSLLKLEGQLRQVRTYQELTYFIANEFRLFTRAQQVFVVKRLTSGAVKIQAVSALTFVDDSAPLIVEMQNLLTDIDSKYGLAAHREVDVSSPGSASVYLNQNYPLSSLLWVPFLDLQGKVLGGMVLSRMDPWSGPDIAIAEHLAGAAAFAWLALGPKDWPNPVRFLANRRNQMVAASVVAVASLFPVSMSALAPVEVAPKGAAIVTAGVDGVVESVDVDPNTAVEVGQPLVRISDTVWKNRYEISKREVVVAESQQKKAAQLAFVDMKGRHELAIAQSELELKLAERDYAFDMLQRTVVRAQKEGVAFFADKRDMIGRPVAAGEKLMEIVNPQSYQFNIDLPVTDAIVLKPGARVKVFLDFDPLRPVEATLVRSDYKARVRDNQILAFRLVAEPSDLSEKSLRLGVRGTAEVYSEKAPLLLYLLRRPLAAVRQYLGI